MIEVKIENWTNYTAEQILDYTIGFEDYSMALNAITNKLFLQAVICTDHYDTDGDLVSWVQSIIVG